MFIICLPTSFNYDLKLVKYLVFIKVNCFSIPLVLQLEQGVAPEKAIFKRFNKDI